MNKHSVNPNTRTYDFLINYYLDSDNLEMALLKLAEMNDLGFSPSLKVAKNLSHTAGQYGHARLALELADAYEETTIRRLDSEAWVNILIHSAEQLYAEGVLRCWKKVVTDLRVLVDEGLCQLVLHTAARHGLPVLASEAIRQLEAIGVQYQEYHFSPMLDAFVKNQQLKEAFSVLDLMRQAKVNLTIYSADSILHAIKHDPELIDGAYALLEELHKEGSTVDVIAVNVLIKACAMLNDLQRAVGIYKTMSSLGVQPDAETYEMLLKACRAARHVELGERLFNEMREAGLNPTARSFERLISLVLTQTDYENAFFYLEEMKVSGHTPSYPTYEDIVKKCVSASDGRYKLAVEELKQMGYRVSSRLQNFIDSGGQEWKEQVSEDEKLPFETRKRIWEMGVAQEAAQTQP
ncbi:uncharacterized protein FOMMEDRAFT_86064 [Fomitiporia mediterranea MF3/22]|uniref:uncharacterized protein n=1 Tax=Fomitiporia mediterranea (strain MF3/22) TaxID=694068 RepID=UPI00044086D0|nr:uncharacterized protein FOMMEDRAFT_86064 [Fomitiporia mediterranea MF3/22]EJD02798.1 hypothetical protein FOMMEDRAFT_86064 [Fomitiporia mediterranea MF3/22]